MTLNSYEYTTVERFFEMCKDEELKQQTRKALDIFKDSRMEDDDYVILSVDGFYVIAELIYKWTDKTHIDTIVQPYDKKKIYPIQQIQKKITFV